MNNIIERLLIALVFGLFFGYFITKDYEKVQQETVCKVITLEENEPVYAQDALLAHNMEMIIPQLDVDIVIEDITVCSTPRLSKVPLYGKSSTIVHKETGLPVKFDYKNLSSITNILLRCPVVTADSISASALNYSTVPMYYIPRLQTEEISPNARARSPGLTGTLDDELFNNYNKHNAMLKKDKKVLKSILRLLYYSASYFKIKDDGTIIVKKGRWSNKRYKTTLAELVEEKIPRTMAIISMTAAEDYTMNIHELTDPSESEIIKTTFDHFTTFVQEENFSGICLDFDFKKSLYKKTQERITQKRKDIAVYIVNCKVNFSLRSWLTSVKRSNEIKELKALLSQSIESFENILSKSKDNFNTKVVGRCFMGKSEYDEKFKKVTRVINFQMA